MRAPARRESQIEAAQGMERERKATEPDIGQGKQENLEVIRVRPEISGRPADQHDRQEAGGERAIAEVSGDEPVQTRHEDEEVQHRGRSHDREDPEPGHAHENAPREGVRDESRGRIAR